MLSDLGEGRVGVGSVATKKRRRANARRRSSRLIGPNNFLTLNWRTSNLGKCPEGEGVYGTCQVIQLPPILRLASSNVKSQNGGSNGLRYWLSCVWQTKHNDSPSLKSKE